MTDNDPRVEAIIPVDADLWTCERVYGDRKDLVLRGERSHVADVLLTALAGLLGDPVLAKMDAREILVAVRTLGEIGYHGIDEDLRGELSEPQVDIMEMTASLWAADVHDDQESPHEHGDYSDVQ